MCSWGRCTYQPSVHWQQDVGACAIGIGLGACIAILMGGYYGTIVPTIENHHEGVKFWGAYNEGSTVFAGIYGDL